jgi:hypothetical protein
MGLKQVLLGLSRIQNKKLPIRASLCLEDTEAQIQRKNDFFVKKHVSLLNKYVSKDDKGNLLEEDFIDEFGAKKRRYILTPENKILFDQEFNELSETEVEIDTELISIEMLEEYYKQKNIDEAWCKSDFSGISMLFSK